MEVILFQTIKGVGKQGQMVNVKDGYARNFLIPRGLAIESTKKNLKIYENHKKQLEMKVAKEVKNAEDVAKVLENESLTFKMKVGEGDKLFGSVTNADIAEKLKEKGYDIDKKKVHIDEPIKSLGVYTISIKLLPEVTSKLKVWVEKE